MTIHWCGTGLSSIPGLRRLIEALTETMILPANLKL
jgi:saccharopine dehydrogenase (NADP+, L-glutamate forming)